jgi:predicted nucleic acid-binding protein
MPVTYLLDTNIISRLMKEVESEEFGRFLAGGAQLQHVGQEL